MRASKADALWSGEALRRSEAAAAETEAPEAMPDERLRLVLTCCHPALAPEARVALVAVGRAEGPHAGLALLAALEQDGGAGRLEAYAPYHAARADLLRRSGRTGEDAAA